jgi:hypothetical protein
MSTENYPSNDPRLESLADTNPSTSVPPATTENHIRDVALSVKGLIKRLEYKYVVESLGANWPVAIVPVSGSFVAGSKTETLNVKAIFCPNFILCPSGSADVLPYNRNYSYGVENKLLFTTIRLKVSELDSNTDFIYGTPVALSCSDCLPEVGPKITLPDSITLDNKTQNSIMVSGLASGISPDIRYSYRYKVLDATWPVSLYPLSGTIKSATEVVSVPSQLVFCETSGNYQTDMCGTPKEKRATLSLELTPLAADTETVSILSLEDTKIISNDMIAKCDDCILYPIISLVASSSNTAVVSSGVITNSGINPVTSGLSVSGGFQQMNTSVPTMEITTSSTSVLPIKTNKANRININASIENLKINRTYNYSLENLDSNWPLYVGSRSGQITPVSSTTTLNFLGEFCAAPSLCPSGSSAVIPYSTTISHTNAYTSSSFKLKLVDPTITGSYYSNNIRVYCSDCSQSFMPVVVSSQVSDNPTC